MSEQDRKETRLPSQVRLLIPGLLVFLCLCVSVSSASFAGNKEPSKAVSDLRTGKNLLQKKKYNEALESLKAAYDELPVVRDYVLFFMAKAHKELGNASDADECIRSILKTYPESQLKKRVRSFELSNRIIDGDEYFARLESYVADYPEDPEMTFLLAGLLKDKGNTEQSRKMFVRLYAGNSSYAEKAYRELGTSGVTVDEMLDKVSALMKAYEYRKAEALLRKMISSADEGSMEELRRKLGAALFGQKKYRDAADAYLKAGDFYDAARSFLRAGDLTSFKEVTSKLLSMEDRRAGTLMIAYAAKKRREGAIDEALNIYRDVKKRYPSRAEEALWGIAWTHIRSRDEESALKVLAELDKNYAGPRYSYWKQRCSGADAPEIRVGRNGFYRDIYGLLSEMKDGGGSLTGRLVTQAAWTRGQDRLASTNVSLPSDVRIALERFAILMELDMKEDAVSELLRAANRTSRTDVILYVCRKLQDAGAYNKSVALLLRLPGVGPADRNEPRVNSLLYPFAYRQVVDEVSRQYKLDPYMLLSVMREESRFDPAARSFAGALGLMQIMPETAYALDNKLGLNISDAASIYNIRTNITLGAYHLNSLLKEFGSLPAALAAYNAGRDKVKEWVKSGNYGSYDEFIEDIPFDETRNYVKRVILTYSTYLNLGETK